MKLSVNACRLLLSLIFISIGIAYSPPLNGKDFNAPATSRNESTKSELYWYVEYKASSEGAASLETLTLSRQRNIDGSVLGHTLSRPLCSGNATGDLWLRSQIQKIPGDVMVHDIVPSQVFRGSNVSSYRLHYIAPPGFQVMYRTYGSTQPFKPGSVLPETTLAEEFAYEVVVVQEGLPGALPGKTTEIDPGDGELRFSLGSQPNGQSAGYLDFRPNAKYEITVKHQSPVQIAWANGESGAEFRCVGLSEAVKTIGIPVYGVDNKFTIRQIIAPQAIVDVTRSGWDYHVKFYHPSQLGAPIEQEYNQATFSTYTYPADRRPYQLNGEPFVSYRVQLNSEVFNTSSEHGDAVRTIWTTTRSEGNDVKTAIVSILDKYTNIIWSRTETMTFDCDICGGVGGEPCYAMSCTGGTDFEALCEDCAGEGQVSETCDLCDGSGRLKILSDLGQCTQCNGSGETYPTCRKCNGEGIYPGPCAECEGEGWFVCGACDGEGSFSDDVYVEGYVDEGGTRTITVNGLGNNYTSTSQTTKRTTSFAEIVYPTDVYNIALFDDKGADSEMLTNSSVSRSGRRYEGGFPEFQQSFAYNQHYLSVTQKLVGITEGEGSEALTSTLGYYRLSSTNTRSGSNPLTYTDTRHDTHHGRLKWQKNSDGGWQMFDYATDIASLGQITKTVTPFGDTEMPTELPSGDSASGYNITTITYANDWEGAKRLPATIKETSNGIQTAYTEHQYAAESANGQPIWSTTTRTYTAAGVYLTSSSKVYQGLTVADWLRDLPYSSQKPDGTKQSVAYHRGTYDAATKTFAAGSASTDRAMRSVVLTGSALTTVGGTLVNTYEGTSIDPLYLIPNLSTAEVTIRTERAVTARKETRLYTGGTSWALIDSVDMAYDIAGNLIRSEKLNGGLYQATYTTENGDNQTFGAISFANSGTRSGRKEYERDEQGLITKFYYDAQGRVEKTVRLALPVSDSAPGGVPAVTTVFTYDDENRILSTRVKGPTEAEDIVSSKVYNRADQIVSETNQGLTTSYAYEVVGGTLLSKTTTFPGGATQTVTTYRDGRPKAITGTASPAQYFTYSVNSAGQEVTTTHLGSENSPRWTRTTTDWAGRTVLTEASSYEGEADAVLASSTTYNSLGQKSATATGGLAPTLFTYDARGVLTRSGVDINRDGQLTTADRLSESTYSYRHDGDVWSRYGGDTAPWWNYTESLAFSDGASTGQVVSRTWVRLTHFNRISRPPAIPSAAVGIAETVTADANGNRTVTQVFHDRDTGLIATAVYAPFVAQPSIAIAVGSQIVKQISPAGIVTAHQYDSLGRLVKTIDRTSANFTGNNTDYYAGTTRVRSVTDNRGVRQHLFSYDSAGRTVSDTIPKIDPATGAANGDLVSRFAYNLRGQLTHTWGDVPYPVKYEYDSATGEKTAQYTYRTEASWTSANLAASGWPADADGDKTTYVYNARNGTLLEKIDAAGRKVTFTYNVRGQTLTAKSSRDSVRRVEYDPNTGEQTRIYYTGESGYTTPEVNYTYDRLGRIKTITDATGTRTFTYRTSDLQPEAETFGTLLGTNRQFTYQYEAGTGRALGLTLTAGTATEYAVSYGFDPANGRLKSINSSAGTFYYDYLANSNLISRITSGTYQQTRNFEANRNALSSLTVDTAAGRIAEYRYAHDDLGRRRWQQQSGSLYSAYTTGADIMRTVYNYDDRNEVTAADTKVGPEGTVNGTAALLGRSFGYAYDPIGNRKTETINGVAHIYSANNLNQYTARATPTDLPVSGTANRSGGASVSINGTALSNEYWRNNYFHRLIAKSTPGGPGFQSITLSASAAGNTQTETVSTQTRPINETFAYDLDGNLTEDGLWHYAYDAENRLRAMYAKVADATGAPAALIFTYDYMGRRVQKAVHSYTGTYPASVALTTLRTRTTFIYQGWKLVSEYSGSGTSAILTRRMTWGAALSAAADVGTLLAMEDLGTSPLALGTSATYVAVHDGNGNLTALVNRATGYTAAEYEYDPFGNLLRSSGSYAKQNPFRFAGKYQDGETGLYYYGFRYYSSSLGRFINRDPIAEAGGLNIYGFANNDGINGADWFGLAASGGGWWSRTWSNIKSGFRSAGSAISRGASKAFTAVSKPFRSQSPKASAEPPKQPPSTSVTANPNDADIIMLDRLTVTETKEKAAPNSTGAASGTTASTGVRYDDPNPKYSKGALTFTTTLTAQHVPWTHALPRPFGVGQAEPMGRIVAGSFIAGDVNVSITGTQRATPGSISFTVTGVTVTFPTTVYYNTSHYTYADGAARLQTQYAENQHAIDFWTARDSTVIPALERMLDGQFNGRPADAEAQMRREILTIFRATNAETIERYDQQGGPHNGGSNPVPNGYRGFP